MKSNQLSNLITWIAFGLVLALVLFVRLRLLSFPLERDEGEYALTGQMFLQGKAPYEAVYNMKLPGAGLLYALWMALFGQTVQGIHIGLLLINIISGYFLFRIARHWLHNATWALVTVALTELLWITPNVLGFAAHATHCLMVFALAGIWLLIKWQQQPNLKYLIGSGLLLGLAFLMKQHAVFFLLFAWCSALYSLRWQRNETWKNTLLALGIYGAMMLVPYLLTVAWIWSAGTFDTFWFWTVEYGAAYLGVADSERLSMSLYGFSHYIVKDWSVFWWLGLAGFLSIFWFRIDRTHRFAMGAFGLAALLSVLPGFHLRPHYFITLLPAVCLLAAGFMQYVQTRLTEQGKTFATLALPIVVLLFAAMGIRAQRGYFFTGKPDTLCKITYQNSPFLESREVARYLANRSGPDDQIAVVSSEPQINFYCKKPNATGVIYGYPITENQPYNMRIRDLMISEIERNKPRFFVFVNTAGSWAMDDKSDKSIFNWIDQYLKNNYKMRGIVDVHNNKPSDYYYDVDFSKVETKSSNNIYVFERTTR